MNPIPNSKDYYQPYVVALTGGIASGKTMISNQFAKLGVPIIDADVIAHEIVAPGQPALRQIENEFGPSFIDSDDKLNRSKLRSLIFTNEGARRKLELILHPKIREHAAKRIAKVTTPYCVLVVPLLTEKDAYPNVDRVLVVDVEPETQINRLMARDHCNLEQAKQALASQVSREQRLKIADDILDNSRSTALARDEVIFLHKKYLQLALQNFSSNQ